MKNIVLVILFLISAILAGVNSAMFYTSGETARAICWTVISFLDIVCSVLWSGVL